MKKNNGFVLFNVLMFTIICFYLIILIHKHIFSYVSTYEHQNIIDQDDKYIVMARSLNILQTGEPPTSPADYTLAISTAPESITYTIEYTELSNLYWRVDVSTEQTAYPTLPDTFEV